MNKTKIVVGIVGGFCAVPMCILGFKRLAGMKPVPHVYLTEDVAAGPADKDAPRQEKLVVKFGNAGLQPLYLHKIELVCGDDAVKSWDKALGPLENKSFRLVMWSEKFTNYTFGPPPRVFAPGAFIEIARFQNG